MQKISKNTKDTKEIARIFLNKIKPARNKATIVGLYGDLGVGKTTFMQFIAKEMNVKTKVKSPTFVIMKRYSFSGGRVVYKNFLADKTKPVPAGENFYHRNAFKFLFHLDAYRLNSEKELLHLGWEEIISDPQHLIFIEWPEKIIKIMPKKHHKILISHTKEGHREFNI